MAKDTAAAHLARLNATLAQLMVRRDELVAAFPIRVPVPACETRAPPPTNETNGVKSPADAASLNEPVPRQAAFKGPADAPPSSVASGAESCSAPSTVASTSHTIIPPTPPLSHISSAAHTRPSLSPPAPSPLPFATPPETKPAISQAQTDATLSLAHTVIQAHIKRLHDYNAVKDVAQGLMGLLADRRGCRLVDVMEELGVGKDMAGD